MTRLQALEAVAVAARQWRDWEADHSQSMVDGAHLWDGLDDALAALDALPAPTPGETVTLAVWEDPNNGDVRHLRPGGQAEGWVKHRSWRRLGTTRLPLVKEAGA
jgi:hypothetical protein